MTTRRLKIIVDQAGDARAGLGNLASGLGKLAGPAGIAATAIGTLAAATVGAGALLVGLGSDAQEMQGKFDIVFGTSAPEAAAALDEFGNAVGRNKFSLMGMAAALQDTFVPLGFARDEAAKMSVEVSKLAVDLGSFNNVSEEAVAADLQSALTGQADVMKKYGVVINQAAIENEALALGLIASKGELNAQSQAAATLSLIMKGTSDAQGDAARTSGSWANQMRALKAELAEAATTMGVELLPVVTPLLADFTAWVKDVLPKGVVVFKEFAINLKGTVQPAMLLINDALTRIAKAFGVQTDKVTAGDVALRAFKAILSTVITAIQLGAIALQGLAAAVEGARAVWQGFQGVLDSARGGINSIKGAIDGLVRKMRDLANAARAALSAMSSLVPHSPVVYEQGLMQINQAANKLQKTFEVGFNVQGAGLAGSPGLAAAGGGGGLVQLVVQYQPIVSTASQIEVEQTLIPLIVEGLRKRGVAVKG
jgi:hypothetical protein